MAKTAPPLVVVDSCVIIDVLAPGDPERHVRSVQVFRVDGTSHRVLLPALVLAEVAGSGQIRGDDGGAAERTRRITLAHQWIKDSEYLVADITERIATQAARLASDYNLKGADACIVAVAVAWMCPKLYTWDKGILKIGDALPGLSIEEPPDHGQTTMF
ncbi:type II toxin-antitoxin system VapC family toxin [Lentzea tibetensis]|uniref:type II toxin-antitoxin system VapC family toxin n=1 Tax=Lentzea tibetensis TaxID=2591470 RepID=UPI00164459B3|nr:type II toxin-antitoxin system VapC family toxin [Lentzea tibetensis]